MINDYLPAVRLDGPVEPEAHALAFHDDRLLVRLGDGGAALPRFFEVEELLAAEVVRRQFLGTLAGRQIFALEIAATSEPPDGLVFQGLRSLYERLEEHLFELAGRAIQIVRWDRDHQFCGRCGGPTEDHRAERAKVCPSCGHTQHPRVSPAVIVRVVRGDEILLARSPHFPPGMYSTLAGFVEPGETLEQTVAREIREEVGIEVKRVRYFGSQPWPFPHSLMVGFTADWAGGDLEPDCEEIEDAAWFPSGRLPQVPPRISIARHLIDSFVAEHG